MITKLKQMMGALKRDEQGVSALEYVILAAVVVGAVVLAAPTLENVLKNSFNKMGTAVNAQVDKATNTTPGT